MTVNVLIILLLLLLLLLLNYGSGQYSCNQEALQKQTRDWEG